MALETTMFFLLLIMLPVATEAKKPAKSQLQAKFTRGETCEPRLCLKKCCPVDSVACFKGCCQVGQYYKDCMETLKPSLAEYHGSKGSTCAQVVSSAVKCYLHEEDNYCYCKAAIACKPGWREFDGRSCYYVDDTITQKWSDARAVCKKLGGDLVVISSDEENYFVYELVMEQKTVTETKAWIGLKKNTADSKWYWVDGTPLEGHYQNWGEGEPNNVVGKENCVHFFGQPEKWNDAACEMTGGWASKSPMILCEKPTQID